jgi:hypothetical protein
MTPRLHDHSLDPAARAYPSRTQARKIVVYISVGRSAHRSRVTYRISRPYLPRRDPRDITDRLGRRTKKSSRRVRTSSSWHLCTRLLAGKASTSPTHAIYELQSFGIVWNKAPRSLGVRTVTQLYLKKSVCIKSSGPRQGKDFIFARQCVLGAL